MAIKNIHKIETGLPVLRRGFALLVAVIFMSVMLTFGLALASLAYKQQVLASLAVESQHAFYAADAALECALRADQQLNLFSYPPADPGGAPTMICDGGEVLYSRQISYDSSQWVITQHLSLDSGKRCADVTIYKPNPAAGTGQTYVFSQGYDVSCDIVASPSGTRFVSRGLNARY